MKWWKKLNGIKPTPGFTPYWQSRSLNTRVVALSLKEELRKSGISTSEDKANAAAAITQAVEDNATITLQFLLRDLKGNFSLDNIDQLDLPVDFKNTLKKAKETPIPLFKQFNEGSDSETMLQKKTDLFEFSPLSDDEESEAREAKIALPHHKSFTFARHNVKFAPEILEQKKAAKKKKQEAKLQKQLSAKADLFELPPLSVDEESETSEAKIALPHHKDFTFARHNVKYAPEVLEQKKAAKEKKQGAKLQKQLSAKAEDQTVKLQKSTPKCKKK